ncbi:hypothetical protein Tco_0908983 [Tanacetum coccineum]|uniref:Uncharacterized protein n=1 Tax=Tanacetum coccineum TaxID=301880 RepID=A0ABQ5CS11_9ASTR
MLKLAKLFQEPEQPLIISSKKVNADDSTGKSLSGTSVQPITQPKAPTDLKLKKKRIPPSSKPKSSYKVRVILPKKQVAETQHAEETEATADATQSLGASESAEDQVNQPKTANAKKLGAANGDPSPYYKFTTKKSTRPKRLGGGEGVWFKSIGDVTFDQIMNEINQKNKAAQEKLESLYDTELRSMPDDDPISLPGFETPNSADNDSREGTVETFNASTNMPAQSNPLGHIHEELCTLNTKVDQFESTYPRKSMFKDMVLLLEAAEVFKKANTQREEWEKNNPETPTKEKDAQNSDQT